MPVSKERPFTAAEGPIARALARSRRRGRAQKKPGTTGPRPSQITSESDPVRVKMPSESDPVRVASCPSQISPISESLCAAALRTANSRDAERFAVVAGASQSVRRLRANIYIYIFAPFASVRPRSSAPRGHSAGDGLA